MNYERIYISHYCSSCQYNCICRDEDENNDDPDYHQPSNSKDDEDEEDDEDKVRIQTNLVSHVNRPL